MEILFSINGKISSPEEALISASDRGFLYGDGVFETFHAYGRVIFRLPEHLRRLQRGASQLFFKPAPDLKRLVGWLRAAVATANFPEASVRLTLSRGCGPRGPSLKGPFVHTIVIMVTRHERPPQKRFEKGVRAIIGTVRRQEAGALSNLKTLNYLEQVLARREAEEAGADEALLLNNAGLLCEGSASNISLIRNGGLLIPDPVRSGALPGTAQLAAVEAARRLKIPVLYTVLSPWDAFGADEAFLSGSMREISPLVQIGVRTIASGRPGPLTQRILAEYRRIVERECKPFKF
jgi:branched-chain amino acid aminotransferase